jgi:D-alanine-D-alanine ligase
LLRIGISYDSPHEYETLKGTKIGDYLGLTGDAFPPDLYAEFEPESTILAMEAAIVSIGAQPVRLGGPFELLKGRPDVDLIWNISEGFGTRNRESWVPNLCEMYGIPYIGSDGFCLTQSLDKAFTKEVARNLGIPTSGWWIAPFNSGISGNSRNSDNSEASGILDSDGNFFKNLDNLPYPLFLKPRYEGTAKGITAESIVRNAQELQAQISRLWKLYKQDVLIELLLPGTEYTVAVSGTPLRAHPVLERAIDSETGIGFHVMDAIRERDGQGADGGENRGARTDSGEAASDQASSVQNALDQPASDQNESYNALSHQFSSEQALTDQTYSLSNELTPKIEQNLQRWSLEMCAKMKILDFARFDFKADAHGNVYLLEVNPLPTFAVDNTFAILAELEGVPFESFLGNVLKEAVSRVLNTKNR